MRYSWCPICSCTWLGLTWIFSVGRSAPIGSNVNLAEVQNKVNSTHVHEQMGHHVEQIFFFEWQSGESVVLGAVNTRNNWSLQPLQPGDAASILQKCTEMMPNLRRAQVVQESIGLRPVRRDGVRIGYEEMALPRLKVKQ